MKPAVVALLFAFTAPAIWAQKFPRHPAVAPDGSTHSAVTLRLRSLKGHSVTEKQAAAVAPGVAQCHLDANGALSGAFINTATIPSGSTITGSITLLDDNSSIDFTGEQLQQALTPGSYIVLPTIANFGELWSASGSAFDIAVQIQPPRGATTEVDCQVLLGEVFANSDLPNVEPIIGGTSLKVAANNDLDLALNGYFTTDPAQVVLTDFYSVYVVPANAVNVVSGGEIDVDLSQIQGLDLTSSDTLFVTVSQAGFSDTVEYRYLPGPPGSFNPAPQ